MKKRADESKDFKLTHNIDALDEFLGGVENLKEGNFPDNSHTLEFLARDGAKLAFLHPQQGHTVLPGFVVAHSAETLDIINAENFYDQDFGRFQPLIALPGNRLAAKTEPEILSDIESEDSYKPDRKSDAQKLKSGTNVVINDNGEFVAEQYGFVILINGILSIISPLSISQDKLRIDWLLSSNLPTGITRQMIEFWLCEEGVDKLPDESLDDLLQRIQTGSYEPGLNTVIWGTPPEHGDNGKIEWHVNIDLMPGKQLPDGRVDFRERNYVVNVTAGQILGVLKPPIQGKPGLNVFGLPLSANDGIPLQIEDGDNVRKENRNQDIIFLAEIDGAFHFDHNIIFITDVLILPEGVNYKTGNITFSGDVVVEGDIEPGFSIRAGGDIIVTDSIENGSILEARGKVIVGSFINGNQVLVKAGSSVNAGYVNEATIIAGQDIILRSYARHAKLRAQRLIQVKKNFDKLGGSVFGGESWAGQTIDIHVAGTEAWIQTDLVAGISPEHAEKLDQILESIESKNNHIRQILGHFGLFDIDLDKLKSMIENAQGIKKKSMALRAKYLVKAGRQLQQLLVEKMRIATEIGPTPKDAEVIIRETAYANTNITIGKSKRKIDYDIGPTRFYLQNDVLVSR